MAARLSSRLQRLSTVTVLDHEVRVATGFRARLLGLSHLDWEEAGTGLFIPRCSSVHTFGMRFPLDLYFLDAAQVLVAVAERVPRRRIVVCNRAAGVLERPVADSSLRLSLTA